MYVNRHPILAPSPFRLVCVMQGYSIKVTDKMSRVPKSLGEFDHWKRKAIKSQVHTIYQLLQQHTPSHLLYIIHLCIHVHTGAELWNWLLFFSPGSERSFTKSVLEPFSSSGVLILTSESITEERHTTAKCLLEQLCEESSDFIVMFIYCSYALHL